MSKTITSLSIGGRRLVGCKIGGGSMMHSKGAYEELAFVETDGESYFDSGIRNSGALRIEIKAQITQPNLESSNCAVFGLMDTFGYSQLVTNAGNGYFIIQSGSGGWVGTEPKDGKMHVHICDFGRRTYAMDKNEPMGIFQTQDSSKTHFIGRVNTTDNSYLRPTKLRIGYFKISNPVVADFRPVRRVEDGVLGLLDIVSNRFITSPVGTLIAGAPTGKYY